jgi:uncharacterized membrane protein YagU involved in acid resistance
MLMGPRHSVAKTISLTLLISGTLDICDALLYYGLRFHVPPARLLQSIASHLIGRSAFSGGLHDALLGLALHYFIAACWIAVFVLVAQRVAIFFQHPILCGALYGLLIYCVMNFLILPHTRNAAPLSRDPFNLLNGVFALVIFMGLFVALCNQRFAPAP